MSRAANDRGQRIQELNAEQKRALLARMLRDRATGSAAIHPLSYGQRALWMVHHLDPDCPAFHEAFACRIRGRPDVEQVIGQAVRALTQRHPTLRTVYPVRDGEPCQQVLPAVPVVVPVTDAAGWTTDQLRQRLVQEASRPFDLERGPVLRLHLFRTAANEQVVLIVFHHSAVDLWSFMILTRELQVLLGAQLLGVPAPLPPVPATYLDFVRWQQRLLDSPAGQAHWDYWRQRLAGPLPVLDLPTDYPRPPLQTYRGAEHPFRLGRELTQRLKDLSRAEQVTLYTTLLAAYHVLLSRYSGQTDILVGSITAGRSRPELQSVVGFFANAVALRADLSADPPFRAFLGQVRQTVLGALEHQDYPFPLLVQKLQPVRDPSRPALCSVTFSLLQPRQTASELDDPSGMSRFEMEAPEERAARARVAGFEAEILPVDLKIALTDADLKLCESQGQLGGCLCYNTALFHPATAARLVDSYTLLLEGIVANPGQKLSLLPILAEGERRRLLQEWNETARDFGADRCIHHLIEEQVERTPDALALAQEGERLSYRQLNDRANQLAHHLRSLGAGPETTVAVWAQRCPDTLVAILAILKAGGAYLPLDPGTPPERRAFMLADSGAAILLARQSAVADLADYPGQIVWLDTDGDRIAQQPTDNLNSGVSADNLAYLIYTSGSTGQPRGVLVPHRAVVNHNRAMTERFALSPGDRVLQFASLAFDAAVEEIFPTWQTGACLVLRGDSLPSSAELIELIEREGLTVLDLPTAYWHAWVEELTQAGRSLPPSLRLVIVGGEKAAASSLQRWQRLRGAERVRWLNTYGPTETTVVVTAYEARPGGPVPAEVPIGWPIANLRAYVLDENMQPVPIGVAGELYIGGAGVARGYRNAPQLTAERFLLDPFSSTSGARLYRTGDRARWRAETGLEVLGRRDDQVKLRGFRIELGEIEAILGHHAAVSEAVVIAREDQPGDKRLVAYVTLREGMQLPLAEMCRHVRSKLPDYMTPSAVVIVDRLPLTTSGKVDRRALPPPAPVSEEARTLTPPRDDLERRLVQMWEELLGRKPIGIRDSFFELGGHSLLALRLVSQLSQLSQENLRPVSLAALFRAPTIENLASLLRQKQAPADTLLWPLRAGGSKPPFFCVPPIAGVGFLFVELAQLLGDDQPFYALQSAGLDGSRVPATLEEMAADFVRAVRSVQPEGPYFLGGYSMGGSVAYEMARQLQAQGQEVAFLALFDAECPNIQASPSDEGSTVFWQEAAAAAGLPLPGDALRRLYELRPDEVQPADRDVLIAAGLATPEMSLDELRPLFAVFGANRRAFLAYRPQPLSCPLTYFRAAEPPLPDPLALPPGWSELASVEVELVPGGHHTLMRPPHVQVLADRLRGCMDRARRSHASA